MATHLSGAGSPPPGPHTARRTAPPSTLGPPAGPRRRTPPKAALAAAARRADVGPCSCEEAYDPSRVRLPPDEVDALLATPEGRFLLRLAALVPCRHVRAADDAFCEACGVDADDELKVLVSLLLAARPSGDESVRARPLPRPELAVGHKARIALYYRRRERGQELFHPHDRVVAEGACVEADHAAGPLARQSPEGVRRDRSGPTAWESGRDRRRAAEGEGPLDRLARCAAARVPPQPAGRGGPGERDGAGGAGGETGGTG